MTASPDAGLIRPDGCHIDLEFLHAVATETNQAHKALGTQLLAIERHGVTIGLPWRSDLAANSEGTLANGVLATLLDHACSLAAFLSFNGDYRHGGTMSLRVEYVKPLRPYSPVRVRAHCEETTDAVAYVYGAVFHPDMSGELLAIARCTIAVVPQ